VALRFAALVASAACAPLSEETSARAPNVASSTVVLVGVELSAPLDAVVAGGSFSSATVVDGSPAQLLLLSWGSSVLRLPLESDAHANGLDEFEGVQWSVRLAGCTPDGDPVWNILAPVRRSKSGQFEIPEPMAPSGLDFVVECDFGPEPYRPVAVAAAGARVAIAWREWVYDDHLCPGDIFVSLSDAASGTLLARSQRFETSGVSFRLHDLADLTGDGEPELALVGELDDIEQLVMFDGRSLEELSRAVHAAPVGWHWSWWGSTVIGEVRDRVVLLLSNQDFGPRRVDVLMTGASPTLSYQALSQLPRPFQVHAVEPFDGGSVLASLSDRCSRIGSYERDCLWAVIPDLAGPAAKLATLQPVLIGQGSRGHPNAWRIPDWDGDGRSEVLATDGIGGLLLFPSTRLGAPLHVASPDGWEVDGRSTSVVEHAGRPFVVTNAVRLADSTRWTSVMELHPRTVAPAPGRR
jgi:hypothetical protein